jgi:hypothetical protein
VESVGVRASGARASRGEPQVRCDAALPSVDWALVDSAQAGLPQAECSAALKTDVHFAPEVPDDWWAPGDLALDG